MEEMYRLCVLEDTCAWQDVLSKHGITDIYYRHDYANLYCESPFSWPVLIVYGNDEKGFCYVAIIKEINSDNRFKSLTERFYDMETPYGYGGPIFWGDFKADDRVKCDYLKQIRQYCHENAIISFFVRFHPFFYDNRSSIICDETRYCKSTVYMDTSNIDRVVAQMDSQYRRKYRRAKEAGVSIKYDKGEHLEDFIKLYNLTMKEHNAKQFYYFSNNYYKNLIESFNNNMVFFYAVLNDQLLGASLFLYDMNTLNYHLGGRDYYAPSVPFENMLMTEAAIWASSQGISRFHLGGGIYDNDSLFQYKKRYNRNGILPFYIGRIIFNKEAYIHLVKYREESDPSFDSSNSMYIKYRY